MENSGRKQIAVTPCDVKLVQYNLQSRKSFKTHFLGSS